MSNNNRPSRSPPRLRINPPSPQSFYSPSPIFTPSTLTSSAASIKTPKATATVPTTPIAPTTNVTTIDLDTVIAHLNTTLHPLVSATTGLQHPYFPRTLLSYHLLTSAQLDELARHYHQVTPPVPGTFSYPVTVPAWVNAYAHAHGNGYMIDEVDLRTKRRRFGRFIGLRGCESPIQLRVELDSESGSESWCEDAEMEEAMAMIEREWDETLQRAAREDGDGFRMKW